MTTEYIYGLKCPIEGVVMYVGRSVDPYMRLEQHMSTPSGDSSRRAEWLRRLKAQGLRPVLVILDMCGTASATEREVHWIKIHRDKNPELKNSVLSYAEGALPHRISLRISSDLHKEIVAAAKAKNLSLNAFIVMALDNMITFPNRLAVVEEKLRYLTDGP